MRNQESSHYYTTLNTRQATHQRESSTLGPKPMSEHAEPTYNFNANTMKQQEIAETEYGQDNLQFDQQVMDYYDFTLQQEHHYYHGKYSAFDIPKLVKDRTLEIQRITGLDFPSAQQLAYQQGWDIYKCHQYVLTEHYKIYRNMCQYDFQKDQVKGLCDVCQLTQKLVPNICSHKYCQKCWLSYIQVQINSKSEILPKCFSEQCQFQISMKLIYFLINPPSKKHLFQKYNKLLENSYVNKLKIKIISQENVFLKPHNKSNKKWNDKLYQAERDGQIQRIEFLNINQLYIIQDSARSIKKCPFCLIYVEKTFGCNNIACLCGRHFCWRCEQQWSYEHICSVQKSQQNIGLFYLREKELKQQIKQTEEDKLFQKYYRNLRVYENVIRQLPNREDQCYQQYDVILQRSTEQMVTFYRNVKMLKQILIFLSETVKLKYYSAKVEAVQEKYLMVEYGHRKYSQQSEWSNEQQRQSIIREFEKNLQAIKQDICYFLLRMHVTKRKRVYILGLVQYWGFSSRKLDYDGFVMNGKSNYQYEMSSKLNKMLGMQRQAIQRLNELN